MSKPLTKPQALLLFVAFCASMGAALVLAVFSFVNASKLYGQLNSPPPNNPPNHEQERPQA